MRPGSIVSSHGNNFVPCVCHPNAAHPHNYEPNLRCTKCGRAWAENQTENGVTCPPQEDSHE